MLLLGSIRSIMRICIRIGNAMPSYIGGYIALLNCFFENLPSMVFTPPSVPLLGDRNPQGREDVTALRCSEPLRYKVGGPKRSSP